MKEIKTHISPDGTTTIETSGFKGKTCQETTEKLLKDLESFGISVQVKEDKRKAEYYEIATGTANRNGY